MNLHRAAVLPAVFDPVNPEMAMTLTTILVCVLLSALLQVGVVVLDWYFWYRALWKHGRVITWDALQQLRDLSTGTLILNTSRRWGRLWWVEGRLEQTQTELAWRIESDAKLVIRAPRLTLEEAGRLFPTAAVVWLWSAVTIFTYRDSGTP